MGERNPSRVAVVTYSDCCWALVGIRHKTQRVYLHCSKRPRPNKLTCTRHADLESVARRLYNNRLRESKAEAWLAVESRISGIIQSLKEEASFETNIAGATSRHQIRFWEQCLEALKKGT